MSGEVRRRLLINAGVYTAAGFGLYYFISDMGTRKMKDKLEAEGRIAPRNEREKEVAKMMDILKSGGPADLSKLREETTKRRYKVAEENTKYAVEPATNDQDDKTTKPETSK